MRRETYGFTLDYVAVIDFQIQRWKNRPQSSRCEMNVRRGSKTRHIFSQTLSSLVIDFHHSLSIFIIRLLVSVPTVQRHSHIDSRHSDLFLSVIRFDRRSSHFPTRIVSRFLHTLLVMLSLFIESREMITLVQRHDTNLI